MRFLRYLAGMALVLALCLVLTAPMAAFAQTEGPDAAAQNELLEVEVPDLEAYVAAIQSASPNAAGDSLLKPGHYEKYIDRVNVPDYALELYNTLVEAADGDGTNDGLIDMSQAELSAGSYGFQVTTFTVAASERDAAVAETMSYIWAVTSALDRDHPEIFWLTGRWNVSYSYSTGSETSRVTVYLKIKEDMILPAYQNPETLYAAIAQRDGYVNAILAEMPSDATSHAGKMRYFNDWLTKNNEYNTVVAGVTGGTANKMAWECMSALAGSEGADGPVCEGYARAFKVLCDHEGIPCVLVSGDTQDINTGAKNGHMWNYAKLSGAWYGVDVTWNDPVVRGITGKVSGYERDSYLFVGANTVIKDGRTFLEEHPVENSVSDSSPNFVNGPELSPEKYVDVPDAVRIGNSTYGSVDAALADYVPGGEPIQLLMNLEGNVTLDQETVLDLNGNTLTGSVSGEKLHVIDTASLGSGDGSEVGKILGTLQNVAAATEVDGKIYVHTEEGEGSNVHSFRLVTLKVTQAHLRPVTARNEPGLYFTSQILCDDKALQYSESWLSFFGTAVRKNSEAPANPDLDEEYAYSRFEGDRLAGMVPGTLVDGMMRAVEAGNQVYCQTYFKAKDGEVFYSAPVNLTLQYMIETADAMWDTVPGLNEIQKLRMKTMYDTWKDSMSGWNIDSTHYQEGE